MSHDAIGRFDIEMILGDTTDPGIGTYTLNKRFHGDLVGTSTGHMLAHRTATPGSAGYVLMERVIATLDGRTGSFILQHSGTLTRGRPDLNVSVIPDSGTGDLAGITGRMTIDAANDHAYVFSYDLPPPVEAI